MIALNIARDYLRDKMQQHASAYQLDTQFEQTGNLTTHAYVTIRDEKNHQLANITIEKAIGSALQQKTNMTNKQLHNCVIIHSPSIASNQLLPLIAYFALRQARIWRCQNIIFAATDQSIEKSLCELLKLAP